jgi:hypothetical protein
MSGYYIIPVVGGSQFSGGTVSGDTNFLSNLSANTFYLTNTPNNNNSSNYVLVYNNTTNVIEYRDASSIGVLGNFLPISGGTLTGQLNVPSISGSSITGFTFYSGSTPLQNIFPYSGTNIGSGSTGIFAQKNNDLLEFKTLSAGTKVSITGTSDTVIISTSGINNYYIQTIAPSGTTNSPLYDGDRWFNTVNGLEFVYIDDGNSSQWVEIFAATPQYENYGTYEINVNSFNLSFDYFYYGIIYDGAVNLFLPSCTGLDGKKLTIKDELGNCNQLGKRIRLSGATGENIDGNNYVDMAISKMALQVISRSNNWYII